MTDQRLRIIYDAVDNASRVAGKVNSSIQKNKAAIQSMGRTATVAGAAIVGVAGLAVKFGSDLVESVNAVEVIFGDASQTILDFGKTASTVVGLANADFNQLASVTGALFRDIGLSEEEVAQQTIELTKRASDLASVFNTPVKEALAAINAAVRGETEPIRRFSGDVTDATLKMEALSLGISKSVEFMSEQEKRLLRVKVIMRQTADVEGDFVRTSEEFANAVRIATSQIKDQAALIGGFLLPVLKDLLKNVAPIIKGTGAWIKENPKLAGTLVKVVAAVGAALLILGPLLIILPSLAAGFTLMLGPIGLVILAIVAVTAASTFLVIAWKKNLGGIREKTEVVWNFLKAIYDSWAGWLLPGGRLIKAFVFLKNNWREIIDAITKVAEKFANGFIKFFINPVIKAINVFRKIAGKDLIKPLEDVAIATDLVGDAAKRTGQHFQTFGDEIEVSKILLEDLAIAASPGVENALNTASEVTEDWRDELNKLNQELQFMGGFIENGIPLITSSNTVIFDMSNAADRAARVIRDLGIAVEEVPLTPFEELLSTVNGLLEAYTAGTLSASDAALLLAGNLETSNDEMERQIELAKEAADAIKKLGDILKNTSQDVNILGPQIPRHQNAGGSGQSVEERLEEQRNQTSGIQGFSLLETVTTTEAQDRGMELITVNE